MRIHLIAGLGAVLAVAAAADAQRSVPYGGVVLIDVGGLVRDPVGGADWDGRGDGAYDDRYEGSPTGGPAIGVNDVTGRGARLNGTLVGAGVGMVTSRAIEEDRGGAGRTSAHYPADRKSRKATSDGATVTTASADGRDGGATTVTVRSGLVVTTTTAESR